MRKAALLILIFFSTLGCVFAQQKADIEKERTEKVPENVETFKNVFFFRPKVISMGSALRIISKEDESHNFLWRTYTPLVAGFSLKIKKFVFGIALKLPSSPAMDAKYIKTNFQDININIQSRIVGMHFYFNHYRGFFLAEPNLDIPEWKGGDEYPLRKKTELYNAGLNLIFQTTKNFSMNAAFAQSERQKKSKGSFLMLIAPRYTRLTTDSTLVPSAYKEELPYTSLLTRASFVTVTTGVGYGYSLIGLNGRFNFTHVVLGGSGLQVGNYTLETDKRAKIRFPLFGQARVSMGLNGDHFFGNIIGIADVNTFALRDSKMRFVRYGIELGVGMRF